MVAASKAKLKYLPLNDMVLVEPLKREDSGLVMPEGVTFSDDLGRVVAVGPGRWVGSGYEPIAVKAGDVVSLISDYEWGRVVFGGKTYLMTRSVYLKCKVEEAE